MWARQRRQAFTWVVGAFQRRGLAAVLGTAVLAAGVLLIVGLGQCYYDIYFNRAGLPDLTAFTRFEFPTIGLINDRNDQPLMEFARESRQITQYGDIPPIVRDAILATEDKRFFSHNGVDYLSLPRIVGKVRFGVWGGRLATGGSGEDAGSRTVFPQGASTITQQLVRGVFLRRLTSGENSYQRQNAGLWSDALSALVGARFANMAFRKREELRLSVWLEQQMRIQFGSKRRAKEEIFARYASFVYLGHGQYGFARAAEYYFGRPLSTFTANDGDEAALLAGIAKSPRDYAPGEQNATAVLRRRDQTLTLMAAAGVISRAQMAAAKQKPLPQRGARAPLPFRPSGLVAHVLDELKANAHLGVEDLLQGRVDVDSTVDGRIQRIAADALQHGLQRYEGRHSTLQGLTQGAVVVLGNSDGRILAEVGGRESYNGRPASYRDFNRVTTSLRQPGSAMKPVVYLAAFRSGGFTLATLVPDEPISVPDGSAGGQKWIANYDGRFKGPIPIREALAESRNAVAIWLAMQVGIKSILTTAQGLGIRTPLRRYLTTALGASEVTLLELATAYRAIASGVIAEPFIIRHVTLRSGEVLWRHEAQTRDMPDDGALVLIQEGLRGVVRMPTGTAHALDSRAFPIPVMGKTGTTSDFRDALFVGSTYGPSGVTVAVRIGFDSNRSLGAKETGGRVALPVFQEVMLGIYRDRAVSGAPAFPALMEQRITRSLNGDDPEGPAGVPALEHDAPGRVVPVSLVGFQPLAPAPARSSAPE